MKEAVEARNFAYCKLNNSSIYFKLTYKLGPYSNFAVGAALRTTTGEIIRGCNVENGAYTPSSCAERTAISKAVSDGFKEFTAIAVVAYQEESFTTPCGVCRQVLSEFAKKDFPVYAAKPAHVRVLCTSVYELLPNRFCSDKLKKGQN